MTIAILCPTRGRPTMFRRMLESALATSVKGNVRVYAGIMESERHLYDPYLEGVSGVISFPEGSPTVYKWNMLADHAKGADLLMLGSDDTIFTTPYWDKALITHYSDLTNKIHVYHLQDSRDSNGTPHPIVTKEYMAAMGYFIPPIFLHWYVDSWTTDIAKANNCFTYLKDYELYHDKQDVTRDETFWANRRQGWLNRDTYVNEKCQYLKRDETHRLGVALV